MTRDRQIITLEQLPEIVSNFRSEEPKNFIRLKHTTPPNSSVVLSVEFDVGVNYSWSCLWYLGHQHLKYKERITSVSKEEREDDCDDVYKVVSFVSWKVGSLVGSLRGYVNRVKAMSQ